MKVAHPQDGLSLVGLQQAHTTLIITIITKNPVGVPPSLVFPLPSPTSLNQNPTTLIVITTTTTNHPLQKTFLLPVSVQVEKERGC